MHKNRERGNRKPLLILWPLITWSICKYPEHWDLRSCISVDYLRDLDSRFVTEPNNFGIIRSGARWIDLKISKRHPKVDPKGMDDIFPLSKKEEKILVLKWRASSELSKEEGRQSVQWGIITHSGGQL